MNNPISIKHMGFERGFRGLLQYKISDLSDLKLHRYNGFNIELLDGKTKYALKDHCSNEHTSTVKRKYAIEGYLWLVSVF